MPFLFKIVGKNKKLRKNGNLMHNQHLIKSILFSVLIQKLNKLVYNIYYIISVLVLFIKLKFEINVVIKKC